MLLMEISEKISSKEAVKFEFISGLDREVIEGHLALAIGEVQANVGAIMIRDNLAYCVNPGSEESKPSVEIDISTGVGDRVAVVYREILIRQLGSDQFQVARIDKRYEKSRRAS